MGVRVAKKKLSDESASKVQRVAWDILSNFSAEEKAALRQELKGKVGAPRRYTWDSYRVTRMEFLLATSEAKSVLQAAGMVSEEAPEREKGAWIDRLRRRYRKQNKRERVLSLFSGAVTWIWDKEADNEKLLTVVRKRTRPLEMIFGRAIGKIFLAEHPEWEKDSSMPPVDVVLDFVRQEFRKKGWIGHN